MSIATFASKVFEVGSNKIYTFEDFQYNSAIQTEKQDVEGAKPSTYDKGPDLDSMSLKLKLSVDFGVNPRSEWEDWQRIKISSVAYPFILGGKPLGANNWRVIGVAPSNLNVDSGGNILSMDLSLNFEEYVRSGSAKNKKSTTTKIPEALSDDEIGILIED